MEEEEKEAQSAKLQELIRRGGPEDLQEANRLMKVMAGYDTKHKTDYRAKAAEEVGKIQQKARLLEERLQNFKAGDVVAEGDIFEVRFDDPKEIPAANVVQELANALQSAQPKIQKMCEEESDDQEAVAKLFEINDSIHRTIERYKLIKKGDVDGASKIPQGTLGTSTGVSKTADNELSLIDFSGDPEPSASASSNVNGSSEQQGASLQDDLLGLSVQDQDYGQEGGIALGFGANSSKLKPIVCNEKNANFIHKDVPGPSLLSSTTQDSSAKASAPTASPRTQQTPLPPKPNYDPFKFMPSSLSSSRSNTPGPPTLLQAQQSARPPQPSTDPFAALSSAASSSASPLPSSQSFQKPVPSPTPSLFDFASPKPAVPQSQPATSSQQTTNGTLADDDWDFTSALPDDGSELPAYNTLSVSNTSVKIVFRVERPATSESEISINASFSNNTSSLITEYRLQVAVTKVIAYTVKQTAIRY